MSEFELPADAAAAAFTGRVRVLNHAECAPDKLSREVDSGAVEKWERDSIDEKRAGCYRWMDEVAVRHESAQRTRKHIREAMKEQ